MSIKVVVSHKVVRDPNFPSLRMWAGADAPSDDKDPLVVLFTSSVLGVRLSRGNPTQIGHVETWTDHNSDCWVPCSISLSSED